MRQCSLTRCIQSIIEGISFFSRVAQRRQFLHQQRFCFTHDKRKISLMNSFSSFSRAQVSTAVTKIMCEKLFEHNSHLWNVVRSFSQMHLSELHCLFNDANSLCARFPSVFCLSGLNPHVKPKVYSTLQFPSLSHKLASRSSTNLFDTVRLLFPSFFLCLLPSETLSTCLVDSLL